MARVVLPGSPHHITQRGIRRFDIFRDDDDRNLYLDLFVESARRFGLEICAYCLMSNHVHFVAIPERQDSLWRCFHRCHGIYAVKFNLKYGLTGHLFQGRPFSCVLDNRHFWSAVRYVERNPVRARITYRAEDYRWSSAAAHCGMTQDRLLHPNWTEITEISNFKEWLRDDDDENELFRIRGSTFTGRPCGDDDFIRNIETSVGRTLAAQKRGPKAAALLRSGSGLWTKDEIHR